MFGCLDGHRGLKLCVCVCVTFLVMKMHHYKFSKFRIGHVPISAHQQLGPEQEGTDLEGIDPWKEVKPV